MQLVSIVNGVPVATSAAIAEGTENQHKNVMELIRTYQADLEEFGGVAFETRSFQTQGGQQQREVALLNEQQCTLLLTYMRNNEIVRGFKKRLVHQFFELRSGAVVDPMKALGDPAALRQMLLGYTEKVLQLEAKVAAAAPALDFVGRYVQAEGLKGVREVYKLLNASQSKFTAFLVERKIMYRLAGRLTAYQPHIDAGRFGFKTGISPVTDYAYTTAMFTPKGVEWVAGEWAKHCLRESVEA